MGYLCPVCEEPFGDDQACVDHLAVTAILHGGPHETWLAEAVGERESVADADWESVPRSELAAIVADRAPETTDHDHPGDHTQSVGDGQPVGTDQPVGDGHEGATHGRSASTETGQLDADAQAILREARELTREMQRGPTGDDEGKES